MIRENQTPKKAPGLKLRESRMYEHINPRIKTITTGVPPRSRRKAAQGASAMAMRAL